MPGRGEWKTALCGAAGTPEDLRRDSPLVEVALLLAECMQHGLQALAFCKTRKLAELVTAYCREALKSSAPQLANRIKVYRGGYSPADRRLVEQGLHSGALLAVAATNALELGVDVGALDVTLHLGFQGSLASLRQQAGRAGRREQPSLALYVAFDGPLDQHFMRNPQQLFGRPVEQCQVDLGNAQLLQQHLVCAAAELPLDPSQGGGDAALFGPQLQGVCSGLVAARLVGQHPQQTWPDAPLYYTGPRTVPAADVSLRCIAEEHIDIVLEGGGQVLERVELNAAFYQVYDGAIYLFQGRPYLCKTLDLAARVAVVRPVDVKYYTKVADYTDVHVTGGSVAYGPLPLPPPPLQAVPGTRGGGGTALGGQGLEPGAGAAAAAGPAAGSGGGQALVPAAGASGPGASQARPPLQASCETALITGTGQVFDRVDLWLPDVRYETQAAYMRLPPSARRVCRECGLGFRDGVHGAAHAVLNVLPLFVICNAKDVGTECDNPYDTRYRPERLLIFDKLPGGIGIALQAAPLFPKLLQRALDLVRGCPCTYEKGCPACVQHLDCKNYNAVLNKQATVLVLEQCLAAETRPSDQAA
ncbi:hypothetical protein V8C86DRAFT_1481591 [Haematococcus lacustris]